MTSSSIHPESPPRRRRAAALAGVCALLIMGLAAPALANGGPGPQWVNNWEGDGTPSTPDGGHQPGSWQGTPAYTPFAGGEDGDDLGFSFDGTNHVSGAPALGNFGTEGGFFRLRITTTQVDQNEHDLISTRAECAAGAFWQMFVGGDGSVFLQFHGADGETTGLTNPGPVNDGVPHAIGVYLQDGTITLRVDGVPVSSPINGTGDFTTVDQHLRLGGGNPCLGAADLTPFVGSVDFLRVSQGNDPQGQESLLEQDSTPVVPAGGSGSLVVNRINTSRSPVDIAVGRFTAPPGVTFTDVTDAESSCSLVDSTTITCSPTMLEARSTTPVTIGFEVAPSATPDSTLNVVGSLTNMTNTDTDRTNDTDVPLAITIAPEVGISLADPMVVGGAAGLAALAIAAGVVRRRRTQA